MPRARSSECENQGSLLGFTQQKHFQTLSCLNYYACGWFWLQAANSQSPSKQPRSSQIISSPHLLTIVHTHNWIGCLMVRLMFYSMPKNCFHIHVSVSLLPPSLEPFLAQKISQCNHYNGREEIDQVEREKCWITFVKDEGQGKGCQDCSDVISQLIT